MIDLGLNGLWVAIAGVLGIGAAIWRAYAKGRTAANDKRDADDAKNYIEERRRQDEIDVGAGATDGQRIELLKAIRDRNRSGKD